MLNKYIEKQLKELGIYEEGKYEYDIGVYEPVTFTPGHYYMIEVENYIVHPYDGFTLHQQWNNNIAPSSNKMHVVVTQLMDKMVKVDGFCDDNKDWCGWLPIKSCKNITEVDS